jgi:hypothetical protein
LVRRKTPQNRDRAQTVGTGGGRRLAVIELAWLVDQFQKALDAVLRWRGHCVPVTAAELNKLIVTASGEAARIGRLHERCSPDAAKRYPGLA